MSTIEDRLLSDIAAVTGGIVVTDTEIEQARAVVRERVRKDRRTQRVRVVVGVAAALVLVAVAVPVVQSVTRDDGAAQFADPSTTEPDPEAGHRTGQGPTQQLLEGIWRLDNGQIVVRFDADGAVRFDDRGTLYSDPATVGTYAVSGDRITVTVTDDAERQCVGTTYVMRASLPKPGVLNFVHRDGPSSCAPLPTGRGALHQALPAGSELIDLRLSVEPEGQWQRLTKADILHGVWMAEGEGYLLEMAPGGAYVVAEGTGQLVDRGTWALRGSELTLTSSAESPRCEAGDQLVRGPMDAVFPGTTGLRGPVTKNDCAAAWTPVAWILLPHVGS